MYRRSLVACVQLRWQIVWGVYCLEVLTARRGRTDVTPHAGVRDQQPPGQGLRRAATGAHPDIPVDILHAKVKDMTCLRSGVVTGSKTYSRGLWRCNTPCGSVGLRVNVLGCSLRCNFTCGQCSFDISESYNNAETMHKHSFYVYILKVFIIYLCSRYVLCKLSFL